MNTQLFVLVHTQYINVYKQTCDFNNSLANAEINMNWDY